MWELVTHRGLMAGVAILVAGYLLLLAADPMGRNAASSLAPVLILGGMALAVADALRKE